MLYKNSLCNFDFIRFSIGLFLLIASSSVFADLSEQLNQFVDQYIENAPKDKQRDYARGIEEVESSGVLDSALQVGDIAPDFTLPNALGESVSLAELLKSGPVVLTWYRGGWCPYCNIQLQYLQTRLADIQAAGGQLVAVSPELPDNALSTREKHALQYQVLSDVGNVVAGEYGIVYTVPDYVMEHMDQSFSLAEYNGNDDNTLPLSSTYVIDANGKIVYAFLDADYRRRAEPDAIIEVLKSLQ